MLRLWSFSRDSLIRIGDAPAGGMLRMTEEWGEIPPHWMVYFAVDGCDVRAARAEVLLFDLYPVDTVGGRSDGRVEDLLQEGSIHPGSDE
jgi:hypothetical protein